MCFIQVLTCQVEHFLELRPSHESVRVEEGVPAHLAGELLHVAQGLHGVKPERRRFQIPS